MTRKQSENSALLSSYSNLKFEAGCDEAGRGCLAGPVSAAAVILPQTFEHPLLNDSKKLNREQRNILEQVIKKEAIIWAVAFVDHKTIDKINILNASILAMHKALSDLLIKPEYVIVDGNRFKEWNGVPHKTIIKGDAIYKSIAAASILAKTARDKFMNELSEQFPKYAWQQNKGYPTKQHREAIKENGISIYHRLSFNLIDKQLKIEFN